MYTFTKLTLQAATAITSCDVIVTENKVRMISVLSWSAILCKRLGNVYKLRVHVYKITQQTHPYYVSEFLNRIPPYLLTYGDET